MTLLIEKQLQKVTLSAADRSANPHDVVFDLQVMVARKKVCSTLT